MVCTCAVESSFPWQRDSEASSSAVVDNSKVCPVLLSTTMSGKTIFDFKKLQRHQFNKVTKDELIEAILLADENEATLMAKQDEKLNRILED